MTVFKKIKDQPEYVRKAIFWIVIMILAISLFFIWLKIADQRIESFKNQGSLQNVVDKFPEM
ncbi:hypothetical protein KAT95_03455 [Candidatus Parcubacteria bacterium]|nr:hypothetical protein [Candidatus Parcubacteria bacterium]